MSDSTLALILTVVLIAALALWVPLLDQCAAGVTRYRARRPMLEVAETLPDDAGPQLTGDLA